MVLSPLCLCGWRATPGMAEHPWWRLTDSVRFTWAFLVLSRNPPLSWAHWDSWSFFPGPTRRTCYPGSLDHLVACLFHKKNKPVFFKPVFKVVLVSNKVAKPVF